MAVEKDIDPSQHLSEIDEKPITPGYVHRF
jgi:hypothetical protein